VLGFTGNKSIEVVEYLPRDITSSDPISSLSYHFTVDVRCRTKDNHHFLVEMQNDFRDDYHLKSLIEHSRMLGKLDIDQTISDQQVRSEKNRKDFKRFWKGIEGLYTVVITNKGFPLERRKRNYSEETLMEPYLVNCYELRHTQRLDRHYGDTPNQLVLLMLDNLKGIPGTFSSEIDRWAYLFKDAGLKSGVKKISETKEISDPDAIAGDNKAIKAFIERVKEENLPAEVRERYIRSLDYYNHSILDIEHKAETRGQEKGKEQEKIETAKRLINTGIDTSLIVEATKLSKEAIEKIRHEMNRSIK
jgi:hypothetical protein